MLNLLTNAIEACSGREGASVTVTVDHQVEQHKVMIQVIDTGAGIDPKVLGDIFKVFFSTKGSKGTGLGLAVTQAIVREHGGMISVQSDLGKGTSFQIELPVRGEGMLPVIHLKLNCNSSTSQHPYRLSWVSTQLLAWICKRAKLDRLTM